MSAHEDNVCAGAMPIPVGTETDCCRLGLSAVVHELQGHVASVSMFCSELDRLDLSTLAARVARGLCERNATYKSAQLRIQPGMAVVANLDLLEVVLENLLSNAFKFSSNASRPCVTVSSSADAGRPVFYVSDNGVGLAPEDALRIFDLFARAHPRFEGSGIGLAVVRRIVERHGGRIWAQDEPGGGATLSFCL